MEEKKINKMLRRRFSGVGWTLLCYYGIVNLLVIVALVLDLARQGLLSLNGGGVWNPASAMDNGWGYLAAIGVGAVILHGWKGTEFFQGLFARRQKTMTAGTLAALLALCVGTQIVNSLWITLLEWIVSAFGLSVMETLEGVSGEAGSLSMFLYMGIFAPLSEEILFRGIIQDSLTYKYGPWKGILWGAAVFGVVHIIPQQVVNAFLIGLVLGYIYYRTRSLIPVMVIHCVNNAIAYFGWVIGGEKLVSTRQQLGDDTTYYIVYALACVVFVVAFGCMVWSIRRTESLKTASETDEQTSDPHVLPSKNTKIDDSDVHINI